MATWSWRSGVQLRDRCADTDNFLCLFSTLVYLDALGKVDHLQIPLLTRNKQGIVQRISIRTVPDRIWHNLFNIRIILKFSDSIGENEECFGLRFNLGRISRYHDSTCL